MKKKAKNILFILFILLFVACTKDDDPFEPPVRKVAYKITGTAISVDVTLNNSGGNTEQYSSVPLPKTYSYSYFGDDFLYISAQNNGDVGIVTVEIYIGDNQAEIATSSGAYVIATVSRSF